MHHRPQGGLAAQLIGGVDEDDHIWVRFLIYAVLGVHWLGLELWQLKAGGSPSPEGSSSGLAGSP
jgi:hypothetical protein